MPALRLGATQVQECGGCGGLWLDPDTLQRLVNSKEDSSALMSAIAAHVPTVLLPPGVVRYIPCPVCAKLMNRVNFSKVSGVILDVCKSHGVWLDRGELQGVLTFVEAGGLKVARDRERTEIEEEQRKLASMQQWSPAPAGPFAFTPRPAPSTDIGLGRIIDTGLRDTERGIKLLDVLGFVAATVFAGFGKVPH